MLVIDGETDATRSDPYRRALPINSHADTCKLGRQIGEPLCNQRPGAALPARQGPSGIMTRGKAEIEDEFSARATISDT